jgi:hypothetical protein
VKVAVLCPLQKDQWPGFPITIFLYFRPVAVVVRVAVLCPLQKDQWPGFPTAISTGRFLFQTINNK